MLVLLNRGFAEYDKEIALPRHKENLESMGDLKTGQQSMALSIATLGSSTTTYNKDKVLGLVKWAAGIILVFGTTVGAMYVGHAMGWK